MLIETDLYQCIMSVCVTILGSRPVLIHNFFSSLFHTCLIIYHNYYPIHYKVSSMNHAL